jgi:hypothetical protein
MLYNVYVSTSGNILVELVNFFYIFVGPYVNFRIDRVPLICCFLYHP